MPGADGLSNVNDEPVLGEFEETEYRKALVDSGLKAIRSEFEEKTWAAFEQLMVQQEQFDTWFVLPWCYRLHDEGQVPGDGQCFGFKVPPKLGAPVDLSNVEVANLKGYQFWMAEIAKIPPGTVISHFTVNGKLP